MENIYQLTSQHCLSSATLKESPVKVEGCFKTVEDAILYLGIECGKLAKKYEKLGEVITTIFNNDCLDEDDKDKHIVYGAIVDIKINKNRSKLENEEFRFIIYKYPFFQNTMNIN
jgi:hypothetical protein